MSEIPYLETRNDSERYRYKNEWLGECGKTMISTGGVGNEKLRIGVEGRTSIVAIGGKSCKGGCPISHRFAPRLRYPNCRSGAKLIS